MEYVRLKGIDRSVSRFGFGGCPLGGHGWGTTDEDLLRSAIRNAVDKGVTFFDTADTYGLGRSETLIGEELYGRREEVVIATKFGVRRIGDTTVYDNDPAWMVNALDGSLRRLNTDCIDLYQLHYWDGKTPLDAIQATAERMIEAGKIRAFGVTNFAPEKFRSSSVARPVSFSHELNLVKSQKADQILKTAEQTHACFLGWGCLAQGALSGKYKAGHRFANDDRRSRSDYIAFHGEGLELREEILVAMSEIAFKYPEKKFSEIALRWILDEIPGSVTLVGTKSPDQLDDLLGSFNWSLDREDRAYLASIGKKFAATG